MPIQLCEYGCGKEAKYQFKNGKWCCSSHWAQCQLKIENLKLYHIGKKRSKESREKMKKKQQEIGEIIKEKKERELSYKMSLIGIEPCFYCGRKSKYFFNVSGRYCCEKIYLKCPKVKNEAGCRTFAKPIDTEKLCYYGCGNIGNYIFKNGHVCCSERLQSCPEIKNKNSKTNKIKQSGENNAMFGRKQSEESRIKNSESNKKVWKDPNSIFNSKEYRKRKSIASSRPLYNGRLSIEIISNKYPIFSKEEEMRYNPDKPVEEREIQVHCKYNECENSKENGGWFTLKKGLHERIAAVEKGNAGCYFYCSQECKNACILFNLRSDPYKIKEDNVIYSQEEYETWRKQVKKLDNSECQICGTEKNIHVHHIVPQKLEPFFALDPVNGICLCEKCHYKYGHSDDGCKTSDIAGKKCNKNKL